MCASCRELPETRWDLLQTTPCVYMQGPPWQTSTPVLQVVWGQWLPVVVCLDQRTRAESFIESSRECAGGLGRGSTPRFTSTLVLQVYALHEGTSTAAIEVKRCTDQLTCRLIKAIAKL
eukprot:2787615-Amphidinium_carterae.1